MSACLSECLSDVLLPIPCSGRVSQRVGRQSAAESAEFCRHLPPLAAVQCALLGPRPPRCAGRVHPVAGRRQCPLGEQRGEDGVQYDAATEPDRGGPVPGQGELRAGQTGLRHNRVWMFHG